MVSLEDLQKTLARLVAAFESTNIPYHATGGLVAGSYGIPRTTEDIDFVIPKLTDQLEIDALIKALETDFNVDRQMANDGFRRYDFFQAYDRETWIRIDFHVGEAIPGELSRRRPRTLIGVSVQTISPEDAVVSKLLWIRKGSHRSRRDVVNMLVTSKPDLDCIEQRARELGVLDIFNELKDKRQTDIF